MMTTHMIHTFDEVRQLAKTGWISDLVDLRRAVSDIGGIAGLTAAECHWVAGELSYELTTGPDPVIDDHICPDPDWVN